MGLFSLLGVARDGVLAQGAALSLTGQNIANVATPGYTRRVAQLTPQLTGGVMFSGAKRSFDRFAHGNVINQQAKYSSANTRGSALAAVETVIASEGTTVGGAASQMIAAFNSLASFPTDPSVRAEVVGKAEDFTRIVASNAKQLDSLSSGLYEQAVDVTSGVNRHLKKIAELNIRIVEAEANGGDADALRDTRDGELVELGKKIGVKAIEDGKGQMTVFGAGATLLHDGEVAPLEVDFDNDGKLRFFVQGATKSDVTTRITDGELGGIREARDVDLVKVRTDLDKYAYDVATTINAVHAAGYGADGVTGRNLFLVTATPTGAASQLTLDPALANNPTAVAAADVAGQLPGGNKNALKLAELGEAKVFGGEDLSTRFGNIAADIGARRQSADAETIMREDTLAVAESINDSASGVSLDEEMVDLTRYQRAFEASTKVLRVVDQLLEGLLNAL